MTTRLGAWDCQYCGHRHIFGNVFDCPGCGKPRSRGVRFYYVGDGPIVTPEIAKQLGSGGPNWYCNFCDSGNKDNTDTCWNCGAPRGSAPSHEVKEYRQGKVPRSTEEAEAADPDGRSWDIAGRRERSSAGARQQRQPTTSRPSRTLDRVSASRRGFVGRINEFFPSDLNSRLIVIGIILGALIISFLVYQFFFSTHEELVRVSGFHWTQSVVVQEYSA